MTTIVINVIAFAIAYMLIKAIKGSTLFRSVFFMPNLIGGIILGYIWLLLLNGVLAHWGRALTYKASYGFWGLVILVCWQQIGYMMIIYIAGLQALPTDVLEAAAVDGHEVDVLGRGKLARTDEVAFVFTIGIVGDEDDLAGAKVFKRLFNGVERMGHDVSSLSEAKGFGSLED